MLKGIYIYDLLKTINFTRSTVMKFLQEIDPDGINARRSKCLKRRLYYSKVM